jgi:hypothetical protein
MTDTTQNIQKQRRDSKGKLLPKIVDTPMKPILDAANVALRAIRERNPEVPNAVLVIGASSLKKYGHFAPKSWDGDKGAQQHEIMISGESLKRGAEDTMATILHECAHALAVSRDIKDTSRQGRFHNKRFKVLGEELGIQLHEDKQIGWSPTTLPKATATLYKTEIAGLRTALKTYRAPELKPKPKKTTVKIECGCRSVTVPISFFEKDDLTCEGCGETFLAVEAESDDE